MFYERIKAAWVAGRVRVSLPPAGQGGRVSIRTKGMLSAAVPFLTRAEQERLAGFARREAQLIWTLPKRVEDWSPAHRDAVRRLIRRDGLQGPDSPQRALLKWEGEVLYRSLVTEGSLALVPPDNQ